MNVIIPHIICVECHKELIFIEGTKRRTCTDHEIEIKVIDL